MNKKKFDEAVKNLNEFTSKLTLDEQHLIITYNSLVRLVDKAVEER
jgi:hypothetical protein